MERLVEEKVDAFWKGLENVALKRGEVRQALFPHGIDLNGPRFQSHFRKKIKERRGSGSLHMRFVVHLLGFMYCRSGLILFLNTGRSCMGTVVSVTPASDHTLSLTTFARIINAEIRQPKSEQGTAHL
jgi:hypothetical protein